jgi:hypothetical protein
MGGKPYSSNTAALGGLGTVAPGTELFRRVRRQRLDPKTSGPQELSACSASPAQAETDRLLLLSPADVELLSHVQRDGDSQELEGTRRDTECQAVPTHSLGREYLLWASGHGAVLPTVMASESALAPCSSEDEGLPVVAIVTPPQLYRPPEGDTGSKPPPIPQVPLCPCDPGAHPRPAPKRVYDVIRATGTLNTSRPHSVTALAWLSGL